MDVAEPEPMATDGLDQPVAEPMQDEEPLIESLAPEDPEPMEGICMSVIDSKPRFWLVAELRLSLHFCRSGWGSGDWACSRKTRRGSLAGRLAGKCLTCKKQCSTPQIWCLFVL